LSAAVFVPKLSCAEFDREAVTRGGFAEFVKRAWPYITMPKPEALIWDWQMTEQCAHWEALYKGEIDELVVNVPPGQSKTLLALVLLPAWIWTIDPSYRFMTASYAASLARKAARSSVELVKSAWYQERWPHVKIAGAKATAVGEYFTTAGGSRFTTSIGSVGTGVHAHMFLVDDPVKAADAKQGKGKQFKARLQNATDWLSNTLGSRSVGGKSTFKVGLVMQRLHAIDPSQVMIDRGACHLCLPEVFEPERRCVTKVGGDRRTREGELLNPKRFNERAHKRRVRDIGKGAGYASADVQAQLQQNPAPPGGTIFKGPFKRFTLKEMPFVNTASVVSIDCSFKDAAHNDYVAIEVWGWNGENFYLYFSRMLHAGFFDTVEAVLEAVAIWRPHSVLIEDAANGPAVVETLTKRMGQLALDVVAVGTGGGIEAKAHAAGAYFRAGKVFILDGEQWTEEKCRNLQNYPHGVQHDDDTAATAQAILHLAENSSGLAEALEAWRRGELGLPVG
jgi:predicted phage terminase large subunit-like protein